LDAVSEEGLLNGKKSSENLVVHVDSKLKITSLGAVDVNFGVKIGGTLGNINVDKLEVLNFTEETNEYGVEIDTDKSFFSKLSLFFDKEELVEVNFSVFFNTLNPLFDLLLLKFFKALAERHVELLHIFEFFTLLDRGGELLETVHGLIDSVEETTGPVKGTGNWGHVRADG